MTSITIYNILILTQNMLPESVHKAVSLIFEDRETYEDLWGMSFSSAFAIIMTRRAKHLTAYSDNEYDRFVKEYLNNKRPCFSKEINEDPKKYLIIYANWVWDHMELEQLNEYYNLSVSEYTRKPEFFCEDLYYHICDICNAFFEENY